METPSKEAAEPQFQKIDKAMEKPAVRDQVASVGGFQIQCRHRIGEVRKTNVRELVEHMMVSVTKVMTENVIQYDMFSPGDERGRESDELELLYALDWTSRRSKVVRWRGQQVQPHPVSHVIHAMAVYRGTVCV